MVKTIVVGRNMMNSSQQIKYGAIVSYLALFINLVSGLVYTPWVIKSIGREDYGLYTLAMSVITLFVFDFGLSNAVARFLSMYLAEGRQDKVDNCMGLVAKLYLYIDMFFFVVLTAVYFFIPSIYQELTPEEIEKFKVLYTIAAISTVISFPFLPLNGVLTSYEKFVQLKVCDVIQKVLVVVSMTICLVMGYGLYALVLVNAISGILCIGMKIWCINKYTNLSVNIKHEDKVLLKEIVTFSGWTTVLSICQRLIFTIAPTILGLYSGSVPIAIFGIAMSLESYVFSFSTVFSGMFLPKVSRILTTGDGDLMPIMIKVGRIQLIIVGAIVMGFVCLGRHFIDLWVGDGFNESYICTVLIIIPSLLQLPQEIGIQAIIAENKVKQQAIVYLIMAGVNIALSFILAKYYGPIGISVSICIAYFIRLIGLDVILKKELHLDLVSFFKETFNNIGAVIIFVTIVSLLINHFIPDQGVLFFIIKTLIFVSLYMAGIYIVSNSYEREILTKSVKKLLLRK